MTQPSAPRKRRKGGGGLRRRWGVLTRSSDAHLHAKRSSFQTGSQTMFEVHPAQGGATLLPVASAAEIAWEKLCCYNTPCSAMQFIARPGRGKGWRWGERCTWKEMIAQSDATEHAYNSLPHVILAELKLVWSCSLSQMIALYINIRGTRDEREEVGGTDKQKVHELAWSKDER